MAEREPDVVDASISVISEFHTAASFLTQLRTRHAYRKVKTERGVRAKELQGSLEAGEEQVAQALALHWREFGALFKKKDVATREILLRTAVSIRENIVIPLVQQSQVEIHDLDLLFLQGESLKQRTFAIKALDDLRLNTDQEPIPLILNPKTSLPQSTPITHLETEATTKSQTEPNIIINTPTPLRGIRRLFSSRPPRKAPKPADKPSTPSHDHSTLAPSLSALASLERRDWSQYGGPGLMEVPQVVRQRSVSQLGRQDSSCSRSTESTDSTNSGRLTVASSVFDETQTRSSSRSSITSTNAPDKKGISDKLSVQNLTISGNSEKHDWPLPSKSSLQQGSTHLVTLTIPEDPEPAGPIPRHSQLPRHSQQLPLFTLTIPEDQESPPKMPELEAPSKAKDVCSRRTSHDSTPKISNPATEETRTKKTPEISQIRPDHSRSSSFSFTPSMAFPFMSHTLNAFPEPPSQSRLSSRSSTSLSSRTSHIPSYPDSLSRPQSAIPPRPSRSNSYLGLCKGAWSVQESLTSGLRLVSVSEGYSHSKRIWRCRTCGFSGPAVPIRYGKGWGVDESIKEVKVFLDDIQGFLGGLESEASQTASGTKEVTARYRWMLLVKSHVKQKAATVGKHCGESAYKCLLCCAEGKETEGYKDVEMLLRHLVSAHGERGGPTEKAEGINCVVGGKADGLEDWDVNIVLDD